MRKVLIANRGEIASRIIKTCHAFGIETVAVYSDADKELPYVKNASKSYRIGESPVTKSYTQIHNILAVASQENVDAIHPGYGFLSENSEFAKVVEAQNMIFIGPSPDIISLMGDKVKARQTMMDAGIPVVPGSQSGLSSIDEACDLAELIGYPVMIKASGGGGGIGMHCCFNEEELRKAYQSTKTRAKMYFGNDDVFIEKYISNARHIEVQIFGDQAGNIVHLYERDCSIQRRNQKVIEETPSPFISNKTRINICQAAIRAAQYVHYTNAGTVEFIIDDEENFYFLEMNTRLQVEHPITETITNIDLVAWQILVSKGEALPLRQSEITATGHSMEFRLYAEDPVTFLPSPGKIERFTYNSDLNVRIDSGYEEGSTITPYYDPMIAKIIVKGGNRADTLKSATRFFNDIEITGIKTNIPLFKKILNDGPFIVGNYSTSYLTKK